MKKLIQPRDKKISDYLRESEFALSAEVIPPRNGAEQELILTQIENLIDSGAEFLSVTKGAGGSLRGGSLPIVHAIKENFGVPCVAHFTCRDLTPQEVENQLIDHHYFGIRNILALRGDPPQGQLDWKPKAGSYEYAYQLINQIKNLNAGKYLDRPDGPIGPKNKATDKTDFCIGSAVYPEHPHEQERLDFFKLKVEHGAEYGITQMIFDADAYGRFMDLCQKNKINVPVIPGSRILKSSDQGHRMAQRFQVSMPNSLASKLPTDDDVKKDPKAAHEKSLNAFVDFTTRLKALGAPGLHVFVLSDTDISCQFIDRLTKI